MTYSIIFKEPCNECEQGVIRHMDGMGFENCDCTHGFIFSEIQVSKKTYDEIYDRFWISGKEKQNE